MITSVLAQVSSSNNLDVINKQSNYSHSRSQKKIGKTFFFLRLFSEVIYLYFLQLEFLKLYEVWKALSIFYNPSRGCFSVCQCSGPLRLGAGFDIISTFLKPCLLYEAMAISSITAAKVIDEQSDTNNDDLIVVRQIKG